MLRPSCSLFVNTLRSNHGSVLCQPLRNSQVFPRYQQIRSSQVSRFGRRGFPNKDTSKPWMELKTPFLFTVTTGSACVFGHKYFGLLVSERSYDPKALFNWWHSQPDWFKAYGLICGTCIVVFGTLRLGLLLSDQAPFLYKFMSKYFVNKAQSSSVVESCAQIILSSFTHISPLHLGINMYIFYNVAKNLAPEIGKDKFLAGYLFSAVVSGFVSKSHQVLGGLTQGSVGASGAILGLLGTIVLRHPEYNFYIIFLPFLTIPGPWVYAGMLTFDFLGVVRGWAFFDHAGHLGGLLSGIVWEGALKTIEP